MKKIFIGIVILSSLTTFAQDISTIDTCKLDMTFGKGKVLGVYSAKNVNGTHNRQGASPKQHQIDTCTVQVSKEVINFFSWDTGKTETKEVVSLKVCATPTYYGAPYASASAYIDTVNFPLRKSFSFGKEKEGSHYTMFNYNSTKGTLEIDKLVVGQENDQFMMDLSDVSSNLELSRKSTLAVVKFHNEGDEAQYKCSDFKKIEPEKF